MQGNNKKSFSGWRPSVWPPSCFVLPLPVRPKAPPVLLIRRLTAKAIARCAKVTMPQAEKIFRDLLSKDAHDKEARLGLSFALLKQRSLQGAYDNAARVIMLDPLSAPRSRVAWRGNSRRRRVSSLG